MEKAAQVCLWLGVVAAVIGGISRLVVEPFIVPSRAWAGAAVILLLAAIAIVQVYQANKQA
jgi:hypothetical protein